MIIKAIKKVITNVKKWNSYRVCVVSPDFVGKVVEHHAATWEEALEWAKCYPVTDGIIFGYRGQVIGNRAIGVYW